MNNPEDQRNSIQEQLAEFDTKDKFLKEQWDWKLVYEAYDLVASLAR